MNMICLGGRVTGYALARDPVRIFLNAGFKGDDRFKRRLAKIAALEKEALNGTMTRNPNERKPAAERALKHFDKCLAAGLELAFG